MTSKSNNKVENNKTGEVINMKKASYIEEYVEILTKVFGEKSVFLRSFGGEIRTFIEKEDSNEPLILNLNDTVIVGDVVENAGFEVNVKDERLVSHRGVDEENPLNIKDMTISDLTYDIAIEELFGQASVWVRKYDKIASKDLSDNASETINGKLHEYGIDKLFTEARKRFDSNRVSKKVKQVAYVGPQIFSLLVDSGLIDINESSISNSANQTIYSFKGFDVIMVNQWFFQKDESVYFVADCVGVSGLGVPHTEINKSKQFTGLVITALGRLANHIPSKNKKAILKAIVK